MEHAPQLSTENWHNRFSQQARWTEQVRRYVFQALDLYTARKILEVGCGTGVVTRSLQTYALAQLYGLDIRRDFLLYARQYDPKTRFTSGDAFSLPFPNAAFDVALCHYLLLWLEEPVKALLEMKRVTRANGNVVIFAEPDYGGRIDYPDVLESLGQRQANALKSQGADPNMGRKLGSLMHAAGLVEVTVGLLGGQWSAQGVSETWQSEWQMLEADLEHDTTPSQLEYLKQIDRKAWEDGNRILFVPTFYACGKAK
jgi:ubiquinone/menaquinone biosynthesis C-methylase UbiE